MVGVFTERPHDFAEVDFVTEDYDELLVSVDAVYIVSLPQYHYSQIKHALESGKHVLCESPLTLSEAQGIELHKLAEEKKCVLLDAVKTAYATAYSRLLLLAKDGRIGEIYSVDATCTSLQPITDKTWNSICGWGPTAVLPVFDLLGTEYQNKQIVSYLDEEGNDQFTKIGFIYDHAVASIKVGKGVKSEGELIISGTKGYIYVPAPWWKTDYFEIRYEDPNQNRRYFYQLDGEGIRYELVAFAKAIENSNWNYQKSKREVSIAICKVVEDFYNRVDFVKIQSILQKERMGADMKERNLFTNNMSLRIALLECIINYGRRQVEKTDLINEFCKDNTFIFFSALNTIAQENLESLSKTIMNFERLDILSAPVFKDYNATWDEITTLAKEKRIFFMNDEYPYIKKQKLQCCSM